MEQNNSESPDIVLASGSLTTNVEDEGSTTSTQLLDEGNSNSQTEPEANLNRQDDNKNINSPTVTSARDGDESPPSCSQLNIDKENDAEQQQNSLNSQDSSMSIPGVTTTTISADGKRNHNIDPSLQPRKKSQVNDENSGEMPVSLQESDNVLDEFLTLKFPYKSSSNTTDDNAEAQNIDDPNVQGTSENAGRSSVSDSDNAAEKKKINKLNRSVEDFLFDDGQTKKSPPRNNSDEKSNKDKCDPPCSKESENVSAKDPSMANTVEQDLASLFSDLDAVEKSENFLTKDANKSDDLGNEKADSSATDTRAKIEDADSNKSIDSNNLHTKGILPGEETAKEITSKDSVRNENLQIKDAEGKVRELQSTLNGEETTVGPKKNSNLPVESNFTLDRIEIKEEIESIENDNSQGFENYLRSNDESNISCSSDMQLQKGITDIDYCKTECYVVLERCDESLLNGTDHYQSDMKIVSVESLSSMNFTEKYNVVWSYFTKKSPLLAECKICGRALLYRKLYNLTRHLQTVHDHNSSTTNTELDTSMPRSHLKPAATSIKNTRSIASFKLVNDPVIIEENPMHFFQTVNSKTAQCKLCFQYMPYRCLDDLGSLKSHLIDKHTKTTSAAKMVGNFDSSIIEKSAKIWVYFNQLTSSTCVCKICSLTIRFNSNYFDKLLNHIYLKHSKNFNQQLTSVQEFAEALVNDKLYLISESQRKNSTKDDKTFFRDSSSDEQQEEDEDSDDNDDDYEDESNEELSAKSNSERKPRQRTWSHFTKLERGLAQCNVCHKCFSYGGGNLRSLTRHLKIGHEEQKSANQSKQKTAPQQAKLPAKVPKKEQNSQATSKNSKLTRQPPAGKQFLKYFSFLRSNNALCKKCMTKIPFNKQDTKSLLNHYNTCNPESDSPKKSVSKKRRTGESVVDRDGSIKDPDFVSSNFVEDCSDPNKHKTELMAAVELSPKEKPLDWNHFKKLNGTMVQCLHCSKRLSYKSGDTWLLEQHLQLWHDIKGLNKSKNDDGFDASLDDIPLLFRLKNQSQPYTLGDCYYRKKLQYNIIEIGRYFRRLVDGKLVCKLCSKHLQCNDTSTEILMSHILQEHVRKLFKPRQNSNETNTTQTKQTLVSSSPFKTTSPQIKSNAMKTPPLDMRKVQGQSTPLPQRNRRLELQRVNTPKSALSQLNVNMNNKAPFLPKFDFTMRYFTDFGPNSQQCKICNRHFFGKKSLNSLLLSKHLLSNHLKNVVDDETAVDEKLLSLKPEVTEQRKAIINCTRQRIVNKFSEINDLKISCKMCSCHLQNDGFDTMKSHLLKNHQNYLITILKEVKRIQNYYCTNLRKTKRLLSFRKKRILRAKCSFCSREVCYKAGNTKLLFTHLLKFHRKALGKIPISKLTVWKYFSKQKFSGSKCEICFKFISSKIHCNHKVPKLFSLSTGLKLKPKKESSSYKTSCFYFSTLKQYNSECIFCSKSLKSANKIICKIACRFNHGNEYINWLYKNDPVDQSFVTASQTDGTVQKTLSLLEMFDELKNKKINSIKLFYSEFSNKYHCNLCSENITAKYLRFCLYFEHAFEKHKGLLSMHRTFIKPLNQFNDCARPQSIMQSTNSALQSTQRNTKLVKVKLWHHFKVVGPDMASCSFCKTNFRYTSTNVDNLSNHLRVAHLNDLLKLNEAAIKSQQPQSPLTTNARAKKSSTWNYFTESGERGAKCKLCGKQFLFSKRRQVSPLTRHLQTVHKITPTQEGMDESKTEMNEALKPDNEKLNTKDEQTKWVWQYFEKDDKRPGAARCKLCSIHYSISQEQGDLFPALHRHLRLVHNKWLVNVGNNPLQNNQGSKRQAEPGKEASPLAGQAPKRVKFNDSVDADSASHMDDESTNTADTPLTLKKVPTPSKNGGTEVTGQGAKKSLLRFQELEKSKSKKSLVWTYFTPIDGQPDFSRCNICSKSISSKFGISILRTHLRVKHNILIVNMNQYSELKKSIGDTSLNNDILKDGSGMKTNVEQTVSPTKVSMDANSPASSKATVNSPWCKFDKNHPVWSYFKEEKDSNLLRCNLCSVYLSCKRERPGDLQNHLSAKHNIVFVEADPLKKVSKVSGIRSASEQGLSTNQTVEKSGKESIKKLLQEFPKSTEELHKTKSTEELHKTKSTEELHKTKSTEELHKTKSTEELHKITNVEEPVVENEVFYTTEDNLVTVTERGDPSCDETVHYEIVETTHYTGQESTDIVKVINNLLPSYSTGISEDVEATEISPQESELISNIVTSLSNPEGQASASQEIIDDDQLKSIAVLTGETEDTSLTWDFYVKLGDNKVKCDVCSEVLTYESNDADHLTDHIQSKHPAELAQYKLSRLGFNDSCIIVVKNAN